MSEFSSIKLQALRTATLLKRASNTGFFPVKFAKFLRAPFFAEHLHWMLLTVSGFQPATLLSKKTLARMFFC